MADEASTGVVATIKDVGAVAEAIDKVKKAIDDLTPPRSVVLIINNDTDRTLRKTEEHHDHGGWAVTPTFEIHPRTVLVFGSRSKGLWTGTEGYIVYAVEGMDASIRVYWDNPYIGSNSSDLSVTGSDTEGFELNHETGAGNEKAEMRYELISRVQTTTARARATIHVPTKVPGVPGHATGGQAPPAGSVVVRDHRKTPAR